MKTIVVSDTALLAPTYEETVEGILYLKQLQRWGYRVVLLSNRPEYCMRIIGGRCNEKNEVSYEYLGSKKQLGSPIDIKLFNNNDLDRTISIHPNYKIFGNGIKVYNIHDEKIYEGSYMEENLLMPLIDSLKSLGYISLEEQLSLARNELGNRCFKGNENIYKFFNPDIGRSTPNEKVYGMQCSSRGTLEDIKTIITIEEQVPGIVGYELNGKPCFYQKRVNKKAAFEYLAEKEQIDINQTNFILSEITDSDIANKYNDISYIVSRDVLVKSKVEKAPSLVKALYKLDR